MKNVENMLTVNPNPTGFKEKELFQRIMGFNYEQNPFSNRV